MNKIAAKIKANTFEVEDIIKLSLNQNTKDIPILENALTIHVVQNDQKNNVLPMDIWLKAWIDYIKYGLHGLEKFVINNNIINKNLPFALAFIEEIKTTESFRLINKLISLKPNQEQKLQIISSINQIVSFKNAIIINEPDRELLETFILSTWSDNLNEADKAIILLALRGVGKEKSLDFIKDLTELKEPWHDILTIVRKVINKKIKA